MPAKYSPHTMALVNYWKGGFGGRRDAAKAEFPEESTLVDLFEEAAPKVLETSKIAPSTRSVSESKRSAFIGG